MKLITRMPDNTLVAKGAIKEAVDGLSNLKVLKLQNTKGEVTYRVVEKTCEYEGHQLKLCVCYSETLAETKARTSIKRLRFQHYRMSIYC